MKRIFVPIAMAFKKYVTVKNELLEMKMVCCMIFRYGDLYAVNVGEYIQKFQTVLQKISTMEKM